MIKRMMTGFLMLGAAHGVHAAAGDIEQLHHNDFAQVRYFSPIGQSFTAERARYSWLSVGFQDCNPSFGDPLLRLRLRHGGGADGVVLLEAVEGYATGTEGWLVFDVSSVVFTAGQVYTAEFASASARGCVRSNHFLAGPGLPAAGPDYIGGSIMLNGLLDGPYGDLQFSLVLEDAVFANGFD